MIQFFINSIFPSVKEDDIIIGTPKDFLWTTKEEVLSYLQNIYNSSTSVHVNNLYIQNWNKNIKNNPKYEYCRNYVQIK